MLSYLVSVATQFTKLRIILLNRYIIQFEPVYKELLYFFVQKIVTKLSKISIWIWDPVSGKKPIPDLGFRDQKVIGFRIRISNANALSLELLHVSVVCSLLVLKKILGSK